MAAEHSPEGLAGGRHLPGALVAGHRMGGVRSPLEKRRRRGRRKVGMFATVVRSDPGTAAGLFIDGGATVTVLGGAVLELPRSN